MTSSIKNEIREYLSGPRDFQEGVRLYERFGHNRMLKRRFAVDDSQFSRELLAEELRKIAGIGVDEFRALPRLARAPKAKARNVTPEADAEPPIRVQVKLDEAHENYKAAPDPVLRMIRFRDKFPFLKEPDCPDVLKILVSDMFSAFANYKEAFARLQEIPDQDAAAALEQAREVVEKYIDNREIWDELTFYKENHKILGKARFFREERRREDLADVSDIDLLKKLNSARANLSKATSRRAKAEAEHADTSSADEAVAKWTEIRASVEAEIERRKKN